MMGTNRNYYFLFICIMMIGCKTKHKLITSNEESFVSKFNKIDTSSFKKIDSSKKVVETKKETEKKRSIEITFDLDKNKLSADSSLNAGSDTSQFEIGQLIKAALRNASTLKVKLEQSLNETEQKKETTQNDIKEFGKLGKSESGEANGNKKSNVTKVDKEPPKTLTLGVGWWIGMALVLCLFIWYQFFKGK